MKILAQSRTLAADEAAFTTELLGAEAAKVWELQQAGCIREAYFTAAGEAVLVLECPSVAAARRVLATLPLVCAQLIEFTLDELRPYSGFARLFAPRSPPPASLPSKRRRA
ncbi:MAG: superoxide dismutase [Opitutaceae bacterium]|nr:superoxide dismutase [Opitutaceae bacterium]